MAERDLVRDVTDLEDAQFEAALFPAAVDDDPDVWRRLTGARLKMLVAPPPPDAGITLQQVEDRIDSDLAERPILYMRGAYDATDSYVVNDMVRHDDGTYVAVVPIPANDPSVVPGSGSHWETHWLHLGNVAIVPVPTPENAKQRLEVDDLGNYVLRGTPMAADDPNRIGLLEDLVGVPDRIGELGTLDAEPTQTQRTSTGVFADAIWRTTITYASLPEVFFLRYRFWNMAPGVWHLFRLTKTFLSDNDHNGRDLSRFVNQGPGEGTGSSVGGDYLFHSHSNIPTQDENAFYFTHDTTDDRIWFGREYPAVTAANVPDTGPFLQLQILNIEDGEGIGVPWPEPGDALRLARVRSQEDGIEYVDASEVIDEPIEDAVTAALSASDFIDDAGDWTANQAWEVGNLVERDDVIYLCTAPVGANTDPVSAPGSGSNWRNFWKRVAYTGGAPDSVTGASREERVIRLARRSGSNPIEVTFPVGSDSAYYFHARPDLSGLSDITTTTDIPAGGYEVELFDQMFSDAVLADEDFVIEWGGSITLFIDRDDNNNSQGIMRWSVTTEHTFNGKTLTHTRTQTVRRGNNETNTYELNRFNRRSVVRLGNYTAQDGSTIAITEEDLQGPVRIAVKMTFDLWNATDTTRRTDANIELLQWNSPQVTYFQLGGQQGEPGRDATFTPDDLGTTTFNLDGTAQDVSLTDAANDPIVVPAEGYIIAISDVPSLGIDSAVTWMLAADLRDERKTDGVTGFFTNASHELSFHAAAQDAASTGNEVIVQHVGSTTDDTGTATVDIPPTILRYDVTGNATPEVGADLGGDTYSYDVAISQSDGVASARIVGFAGTDRDPSAVSVLATITMFHGQTGTITLPQGVSLAAAGDAYTLRLEVYQTGESTSQTPQIFHDYRIVATEAPLLTHFGYLLSSENQTDIGDFTRDISTSGTAAGTYIVSLPGDADDTTVQYRLYWLVPTTATQPTAWSTSGFDITSSVSNAGGVTIDAVAYTAYLTSTDGPYDKKNSQGVQLGVT